YRHFSPISRPQSSSSRSLFLTLAIKGQLRDRTNEHISACIHRLGEVLAATVKRGDDRRANNQRACLIPEELGETTAQRKNTSPRSQALASIPWEEIEKKFDEIPVVEQLYRYSALTAQRRIP